MNLCILTGRITKDLELRKINENSCVCKFTIATNRVSNGEKLADFINCVVWNKQAENLVKYQSKGNMIAVFGEMRSESYEVNGTKKYRTYVMVNEIEYLESKKHEEKTENNPFEEFGNSIKTEFDVGQQIEISDSDLPF